MQANPYTSEDSSLYELLIPILNIKFKTFTEQSQFSGNELALMKTEGSGSVSSSHPLSLGGATLPTIFFHLYSKEEGEKQEKTKKKKEEGKRKKVSLTENWLISLSHAMTIQQKAWGIISHSQVSISHTDQGERWPRTLLGVRTARWRVTTRLKAHWAGELHVSKRGCRSQKDGDNP